MTAHDRFAVDGYRQKAKETVLDSIESVAFEDVPQVSGRVARW